MWRIALAVVAGGCNDPSPHTPDAMAAAVERCMVSFAGNFTETSSTIACSEVAQADADTILELTVPSTTLGTAVHVAIDLGASPTAGEYSSDTVAMWSAVASESVGGPDCIYAAGSSSVPEGSFTLSLDEVSVTAHGTLQLLLYVLMPPFTDCGPQMTEMLALRF